MLNGFVNWCNLLTLDDFCMFIGAVLIIYVLIYVVLFIWEVI